MDMRLAQFEINQQRDKLYHQLDNFGCSNPRIDEYAKTHVICRRSRCFAACETCADAGGVCPSGFIDHWTPRWVTRFPVRLTRSWIRLQLVTVVASLEKTLAADFSVNKNKPVNSALFQSLPAQTGTDVTGSETGRCKA